MRDKLIRKRIDSILYTHFENRIEQIRVPPLDSALIEEKLLPAEPVKETAVIRERNRFVGLNNLSYALIIVLVITPGLFLLDKPSALEVRLNQIFDTIKIEQSIPAGMTEMQNFFWRHYFGRREK